MVVIVLVAPLFQNGTGQSNLNNVNRSGRGVSGSDERHSRPRLPYTLRHVTRVNFGDVYSQVEFGANGEAEPITKEEEVITKRKTELTTTRQIETRVKRQVVLEDGKVIEDSGPIIETNTTEDTEKQESESTERRNLGDDEASDKQQAALTGVGGGAAAIDTVDGAVVVTNLPKMVHTIVARPDGLVREVKEQTVISREQVDELLETEDVHHLGDFSDEAYVKAVNSGVQDIQSVLLSSDHQKQLVPVGPRVVNQTTKSHKTVDTEDTELKCLAQADGTIVTERKRTTEHEVLCDEDLPEADDNSTGSREKIEHTESSQRYRKQKDEQEVEYIADGKVIGKEMRYTAETEEMERDGHEEENFEWESLSDRVRRARRLQKTLLQQQREAALLAERTDAITKRPLSFDKEEETRKDETIKWLESHFGSDSRSNVSREDDIEPTKKTFFNVTIKSNPTTPSSPKPFPTTDAKYLPNLSSPSKVFVPEREPPPQQKKFFQGISEWSERKESTPNKQQFPPKSFHDELKGTLEKNRLRQMSASREELSSSRKADYVRKEEIMQRKYGSRGDIRYRRDSRDDSDADYRPIRTQKEDLGYMSGSRNDLRAQRKDSHDELERNIKAKRDNGYLHREDSGYVKDSREDVRCYVQRSGREDSFIRADSGEEERSAKELRDKQAAIQRDDSAYVSSSTYFTAPRSPKLAPMRTPDSGIRSPSLENYESEATRPSVPQRKRALERKLRQAQANGYVQSSTTKISELKRDEPPPDYSPPPHSSRSTSPKQTPQQTKPLSEITMKSVQTKTNSASGTTTPVQQQQNGGPRKSYQKTRFQSEVGRTHNSNAMAATTQTTQTQTTTPPKSSSKVGAAIGNSIRKLVGKIRSASAERKLKLKSKRPPSPHHQQQQQQQNGKQQHQQLANGSASTYVNGNSSSSSTYQQYNVIDSHIGQSSNRESSINSQSGSNKRASEQQRATSYDRRSSSDAENNMLTSPKQRYYLGEDPYGGSIFGKENRYEGGVRPQRTHSRHVHHEDIESINRPKQLSASTLGRFSKSTNRLTSSPLPPEHDYRSAQTLPRKLEHKPMHSSTINVSIVNTVKPTQNTGPAKPTRTYKSLNRSKSFNVHGLNGTNDPHPIYMEKMRKNYGSSMYKSNPHLSEEKSQLKSPSIVNLISRSQRDLTKIDEDRQYNGHTTERRYQSTNYMNGGSNGVVTDKKSLFLKGLQDQAPELYKTLHGENEPATRNGHGFNKYAAQRERESSLGSRSPVTINKDTASIVRRGSSSTEDYSETYKFTTRSDDPERPSVTNTVHSFTKKTLPVRNGRGTETIESSNRKSVTTSRYRGEPMSNLKYIEEHGRRGSGPVVIEVRSRK